MIFKLDVEEGRERYSPTTLGQDLDSTVPQENFSLSRELQTNVPAIEACRILYLDV